MINYRLPLMSLERRIMHLHPFLGEDEEYEDELVDDEEEEGGENGTKS
jgi:hypothetical protein